MQSNQQASLNVFQRLIRQWEGLHPYNGAQVLKISGTVDLELCREAWFGALDALGLGVVRVSENSYGHHLLNGEAATHGVVECPEEIDLNEWISGEMNYRFGTDGGVPFRPFVMQEVGYFWMGLCY